MSEKNFANGLVIKQSGDYFMKVGIKRDEFIIWLNSLPESNGWCNATIVKKKEPGKTTHYMEEDTWKPDGARSAAQADIKEDNDTSTPLPF